MTVAVNSTEAAVSQLALLHRISAMIVDEDKQELSIRAARCSSPDYLHKLPVKIE